MTWYRWLSSDWRGLCLVWLAVIVAACQPAPAPPNPDTLITPDVSALSPVLLIAQGRAWESPAVWVEPDGLSAVFAWADGDSVRVREAGGGAEATVPAVFAHRVSVHRAGDGMTHVLWLGVGDDPADGLRLYALVLDAALNPLRPAQAISDRVTTDYSVLALGDGSLWVVWSGGLVAEYALYAQAIDPAGRTQLPGMIQADATRPRFLRAGDGQAWLIYQRDSSGDVVAASFAGGTLGNDRRVLLAEPRLPFGERVTGFSVGADSTTAYAFWNISAPDGTAYTLWSHGRLNDDQNRRWQSPRPLTVTTDPADTLPTGFNAGGYPARLDSPGVALAWVVALGDAGDTLPVAGVLAGEWVIVYLRGGAVFALTPVAPAGSEPVSEPVIVADRQRHLYVGWAALAGDDAALWLWSSRR